MTQVFNPETWLTLYCLPHAGGSAQPYGRLGTAVPRGVRVVPLELPGHGTRLRERLLRDMGQVVTEVIRLMGRIRVGPLPFSATVSAHSSPTRPRGVWSSWARRPNCCSSPGVTAPRGRCPTRPSTCFRIRCSRPG